MSAIQRYYPPISDLISVNAIPSDLQQLRDVLQQGVDVLLGRIYYKTLVEDISETGEMRHYSLTLLTKRLELPIPGGMSLVFFRGSETPAGADL